MFESYEQEGVKSLHALVAELAFTATGDEACDALEKALRLLVRRAFRGKRRYEAMIEVDGIMASMRRRVYRPRNRIML